MIDEKSLWLKAKNDYLGLIEHALAEVEYPKRYEILTQVERHLEQKYAELPPEGQTWEAFRQIITEMGPPEDYAVLLHDDTPQPGQSVQGRPLYKLLITVLLVVSSAAAVWLIINAPRILSNWFPPTKPVVASQFEPDDRILGKWFTVDFVKTMDTFTPAKKFWQGELFLKTLDFKDQGVAQWCAGDDERKSNGWWTKGKLDPNNPIPSLYEIRAIDGNDYLFTEWISGDVTIRGMKPQYYVLARDPQKVPFNMAAASEKKEDIPVLSEPQPQTIVETVPIVVTPDPVPGEPDIYGKWLAVDYVRKADDFVPGQQQWKKKLLLKEMQFAAPSTAYWTFTNDVIKQTRFGESTVQSVNDYAAKYFRKTLDDQEYLFVEWTTLEVVEKGQVPWVYVLKRQTIEPIPETAAAQSIRIDEVVESPQVLGKWTSVDFVRQMDEFVPGRKFWQGDMFLTGLEFQTRRQMWCSFNSGSRARHTWTPGRVDVGESRPALYAVKEIDGNSYMFFEWISGDVTIRGQKPCYYVLKKTVNPQVSGGSRNTGRQIAVSADYCTMAFVESQMGPAERREERMLKYPSKGIDFTFTNGILSEFHLNKGYAGQLKTGISLTSTAQEVFGVYGKPIKSLKISDLHGKNDERILYRNDNNMSRIYYGRHGLIFWFRDDIVLQIVVFKGEVSPVF